jgi:hypothetical protein
VSSRRKIDPVVRAILLIAGLACTAAAVLMRYAPSEIVAQDGRVSFRLFRPCEQAWFAMPVSLLWFLAIALLGMLLVFSHTGRRAIANLAARPRNLRATALALLLLLLTLLPAVYSRTSTSDQSVMTYLVLASLGVTGLIVSIGPVLDRPARLLLGLYDRLLNVKPMVFVAGAAVLVFVAANFVSWRILEHVPRIHDDVAQLFQERLFAHGRLFAASPPVPQFFDMMMMISDGKWYSQYPPGHPLMLMLGVLAGAPWLVNPLLGAFTVVFTYLLGREIFDEPTARLGTLLVCLSPYLALTSGQFINHSSSLCFTVLFMLLYFKSIRTAGGRQGLALLAGLAAGMVVLVRPYTGLLIVLPFVLDAGYRLVKAPGRNLGRFALMALGLLVMAGLLMGYNCLTNGKPFELGYVTRYGAGHGLGFNRSGWGQVYTLAKGFAATGLDLNAVNRWFFEFPIPALLLRMSRAQLNRSSGSPVLMI